MLAAGAVLFGVVTLTETSDQPAGSNAEVSATTSIAPTETTVVRAPARLVVDAELRERLANEWNQRHGSQPTSEALAGLVDAYVNDELLYREGIRLGLDRGDPEIRARVIQNVRRVIGESAAGAGAEERAALVETRLEALRAEHNTDSESTP